MTESDVMVVTAMHRSQRLDALLKFSGRIYILSTEESLASLVRKLRDARGLSDRTFLDVVGADDVSATTNAIVGLRRALTADPFKSSTAVWIDDVARLSQEWLQQLGSASRIRCDLWPAARHPKPATKTAQAAPSEALSSKDGAADLSIIGGPSAELLRTCKQILANPSPSDAAARLARFVLESPARFFPVWKSDNAPPKPRSSNDVLRLLDFGSAWTLKECRELASRELSPAEGDLCLRELDKLGQNESKLASGAATTTTTTMFRARAIGDSHVIAFSGGQLCAEHWLGFNTMLPLTMHRVGLEGLDLDAAPIIVGNCHEKDLIERGDVVVYSYGYIDVNRRLPEQKDRSSDVLIKDLVDRYLEVVVANQQRFGVRSVVMNVAPPSSHETAEHPAPVADRIRLTELMNGQLSSSCRRLKVPLLDLHRLLVSPNGRMSSSFSEDGIHLSRKHVAILENALLCTVNDQSSAPCLHPVVGGGKLDGTSPSVTAAARNDEQMVLKDAEGSLAKEANRALGEAAASLAGEGKRFAAPRVDADQAKSAAAAPILRCDSANAVSTDNSSDGMVRMERHMEEELPAFGFIVLTHCKAADHHATLRTALAKIRAHHSSDPIVVLDDHSPLAIPDDVRGPRITIAKTKYRGSGELAPFVYYLEHKFCQRMIYLHDSMHLLRRIDEYATIPDVAFLWHFTNHRVHWHAITEPSTPYNAEHKIVNHDDLICHVANHFCADKPAFVRYFNDIYSRKDRWVGCFGLMSIVTHDFVKRLEEQTGLVSLGPTINDKRRRCAAESIFALACQFTTNRTIADSFDGLYYDGLRYHNGFKTNTFEKLVFSRCDCANCRQTEHPEWHCCRKAPDKPAN